MSQTLSTDPDALNPAPPLDEPDGPTAAPLPVAGDHAPAASRSPEADRRPTDWTDAPLRSKVHLLMMLAVLTGALIVKADLWWGPSFWHAMGALALAITALAALAQAWVNVPIENLARRAELIARVNKPSALRKLPIGRHDEVGRLAKSIQLIGVSALRTQREATHLRRTLDHRVVAATRRATRQLKHLAMRDPLTELGNRRFLDDQLEPLTRQVADAGHDLICILLDLDDFKPVNDRLGHEAGDELLVLLSGLLRASVRHDDLCVRLGGDEFAVFMPGATLARAEQFAEGLRKLFRQQVRVMHRNGPHPDLSIGIASLRADRARTGDDLLRVADRRLYDAKHNGKGHTVAPV